jgi:hypothetical protein
MATKLAITSCPSCGVYFGVPERLIERAREENVATMGRDHFTLYCPVGHSICWHGKNKEQELRDRVKRQTARAGRLAAERDQEAASAKAQRGAATRARNERDRQAKRAKNGVCPCCNRTFKQLARHMQSQHPHFVATTTQED